MSLRIFFTSDLHLGMKFATLPERQAELAEARFACLKRLVETANEKHAELFVVAGDLFERVGVPKRDVQRAAALLGDFHGALVCVLPGNHDFLSPGDELWRRFKEACGDAVLLLEEQRPYPLSHYGLDACLYPGPCVSKHSGSNAIGWVKDTVKDSTLRHHFGVAHGSLEGFSPDFGGDYYPMKVSELLSFRLDLWLLGHTHQRYPQKPAASDTIFIAGTPEPDGFDCSHGGSAWLLALNDEGAVTAEDLPSGTYRFLRAEAEVESIEDLAAIEKKWTTGEDVSRILLRAVLRGHLPPSAYSELDRMRGRLAEVLFHVELDSGGVREEITRETIDREYPEGSFPHRLLSGLADSGDPEALELAYELFLEARR
jgi:DNA repair exonuclease SbcCD nuclease subunit